MTAGLMMSLFLAAIDGTIVATAMPAIVGELQGFALYPWVASLYLLVSSATVPLYGKWSDIRGRRGILFGGILLFLLGSVLCGFSQTMGQLIFYRALQGLGAGAIMPVTQTIIGDIYEYEERARMQGYFSSVWGISALVGPALGGFLVTVLSWRWVFFVNLPVGLLAFLILLRYYEDKAPRHGRQVDYLGAALLATGVSSLMLFLLQGRQWGWGSFPSLLLVGLALVLLLLFVLQERRFPEPLLPVILFTERVIWVSNLAGLLMGMLVVAISFSLPIVMVGSLGQSPALAGTVVAAVSIGWPLFSTISGRLGLRVGFRWTAILGTLFTAGASLWLMNLSLSTSPSYLAIGAFLMGAGLGLSTTSFIIEIQAVAPAHLRGVATASQQFVRQVGSALGLALMGAVLYSLFLNHLDPATLQALGGSQGALSAVDRLLDVAHPQPLPAGMEGSLAQALLAGTRGVYLFTLAVSLVAFLTVLFFPRGRRNR
ncbi:MAG: MDR family MFS transporter [Bacillota bacterium]|nr:MDR family MFS transporter [Bacillota bacterium]